MRTVLALTVALASLGPLVVRAQGDPYADLNAARSAFARVQSARAVQTFSNGEVATVSYQAPDRYRIVLPTSQVIFAGNVEYGKKSGMSWVKMPNAPRYKLIVENLWQFAGDPAIDVRQLDKVTPLGTRTVGGVTLRGYRLQSIPDGRLKTVWIGPENLPVDVQIDLGGDRTVSVHYMDYNAPLYIGTPL